MTQPTPERSREALLPCPFCGYEAADLSDGEYITCQGCGATGATEDPHHPQTAAEAWNQRVHSPATARVDDDDEAVERVAKALWSVDDCTSHRHWTEMPDYGQNRFRDRARAAIAALQAAAPEAQGAVPFTVDSDWTDGADYIFEARVANWTQYEDVPGIVGNYIAVEVTPQTGGPA